MIDHVFVYGTLRPGQSRWPTLAPFTLRSGTNPLAMVSGRLYDTGYGWPAAVFGGGIDDQVPGIVLGLKEESIDVALATLDVVEGVDSGLFQRIAVNVDGRTCWTYHWPGPTKAFRLIPCWTPRPGSPVSFHSAHHE